MLTRRFATPAPLELTQHARAAEADSVLLLEADIAGPLASVLFMDLQTGKRYTQGLLLVRMYTRPIGFIRLESDNFQMTPYQLAEIIWREMRPQIVAALVEDGLPPIDRLDAFGLEHARTPRFLQERARVLDSAPLVSIIVPTRSRPQQLETCLDSLMRLNYPGGFEIIVVDNDPVPAEGALTATWRLIKNFYREDVIYVREERPGISYARNRGLEVAVGEIVAFTDDDVLADANWLTELLRGFHAGENVACVTGFNLPAELETPAQVWYQQERGGTRGFQRRLFDLDKNRPADPLFPFRAAIFGSGTNMAFKASVLREIGGFDPALGIGTETHGGEDLAAYFELILRGYQLAYEPSALVYHNHCETYEALRQQMYGCGVGCAAYLTKTLRNNPRAVLRLLRQMPAALVHGLVSLRSYQPGSSLRFWWSLTLLEVWGWLHGPLAYTRSRRALGQG